MNEANNLQIAENQPLVIPDVSNCPFSIVFNEDCMEGLKRFPDNYFDLAVVDPPYGIGAENHAGNADNGWKQWDKKSWDNAIPTAEYFEQLFRVSKNQIIWGGNYFANLLPNSQGWIFWDKGQRDFSLADGELCWTSFKKSLRVFEMARAKAKASIGYDKIHPTQKPVQLYDFCYNFAKLEKGNMVLDTHLGSGSSRISANKGGFNFIGFETDKEYYEKQEKRFKNFTAQQRLF
jgi:site-specific DNA-methyltransferase (adenine-specific)